MGRPPIHGVAVMPTELQRRLRAKHNRDRASPLHQSWRASSYEAKLDWLSALMASDRPHERVRAKIKKDPKTGTSYLAISMRLRQV